MKKIFILVFLFCFFFTFNSNASIKEKLIKNLENTQNISFDFKQNINDKTDTGKCIIEYPKKIYCEYNNSSKKILVSNGKHLVIKNRSSNQYYIYPIEKTALNLILNKSFLLKKIRKNKESLIDGKYYLFKFLENNTQINIFFDSQTLDLTGWQNEDVYQNLVITYIFNIEKNKVIKKNQFKLPNQN